MKYVFLFVLATLCGYSVMAQAQVSAVIVNLKNDKGVCRACLFNNPSSFRGEGGDPFGCVFVNVKNNVANAIFTNVPPGKYAIMVFHDENANRKLDKNFIGMPKEGYGASNNRLPFAASPEYNNSSFIVTENSTTSMKIKIRNLLN